MKCFHLGPDEKAYAKVGKIVSVFHELTGWYVLFYPEWFHITAALDPTFQAVVVDWNIHTSTIKENLDDPLPADNIEEEVMVSKFDMFASILNSYSPHIYCVYRLYTGAPLVPTHAKLSKAY